MKRALISLLFLFLTTTLLAQKVIENPAYEVKRSSIYDVDKIELTENETRVYVRGSIFPGWFLKFSKNDFLKDCKTGKEYTIIKIEDYNFDEKIYIPESGEKTVVLVFPPLDKNVKKIDFKHALYGISLTKQKSAEPTPKEVPIHVNKWIQEELDKVNEYPIKDFNSNQFFNPKKSKLIGYIKGYDKRLKFDTGIVYQGNNITREDYPIVIEVHEDGRFEAELPLIHPETNFLSINKSTVSYYIEPGQTLAMILDWEDFLTQAIYRRSTSSRYKFKKTTFKGPLAEINRHLMNFTVEDFNYRALKEKIKNQTPAAFRKEQDSTYQINKDLLKKYITNNDVNNKTKQVLQNVLITGYATVLFDFLRVREYEAKKDTLNTILKLPVADDYYRFLKEIDFNKALLVPNTYSTFVNRFEYSKPISIYPKLNKIKIDPEITLSQYLENHKIELTENDKKLREESKNLKFKSYEDYKSFQKKFSKPYIDALEAYNSKYIQPLIDKQRDDITETNMEKWRLRDSVLKNVYHLDKNIVHDTTKIRSLKYDIDRADNENARSYWNALKKTIDDPFLIEEGERIVSKKFPLVEKNILNDSPNSGITSSTLNATTTKLPEGKPTRIFNDIIKQHTGKILFVDFWATTCPPCVGSIKRMKETRAKYKNNPDIDFVFITSNNASPEKTYLKFVESQELVNTFRISNDQFNYLRQLFKFNGIPKYVVIAKNGEVIDDDYKMYQFNNTVDHIIKKFK